MVVKVRELAKALKNSPLLATSFKAIQPESPGIIIPKDVSTRWISTYQMLLKALKLGPSIDTWFSSNNSVDDAVKALKLSEKEWDHVRYLAVLLRPYAF
jgi:hypothetical protein